MPDCADRRERVPQKNMPEEQNGTASVAGAECYLG
jgi:hypothetical protein